ncbi:MAG TPA: hypothetical protein DCX54_10445, partial [Flavobacteriales bacterium]|nr:hypothetical protein [Flavobacteriales bacterium]
MAKKKQQPIKPKEPEVEEFMEIGGSPVPGITLRQVLRGHADQINRIAWSPDGHYLASPSSDRTIRIWDIKAGKCINILKGYKNDVLCVAWSPDGKRLASSSNDPSIQILDTKTWQTLTMLDGEGGANRVAWSPDGNKLASGFTNGTIRIWNSTDWKALNDLAANPSLEAVNSLAWLSNNQNIISGHQANNINSIHVWNIDTRSPVMSMSGQETVTYDLVSIPNTNFFASCNYDKTILIWDVRSDHAIQVLEGHTGWIISLSISPDSRLLASKGIDGIRLWNTTTWETMATFPETASDMYFPGLAFHTSEPCLATLGDNEKVIRIWDIDYDELVKNMPVSESVRYTTAKLVLVGDSGVGKTGLGWRLAHNEFKEHSSTHGQQFWVVPELKKTREDGTECEAVLWDLAGQHIYRSIHSIFLDDVDASLVLFDPTNRQEPLKGAQFWLEQLKGKKQLPPSVLVGARLDRGAPVLSQQELDQFCQKYGISGGYIGTSAKSGEGLENLVKTLQDQIPWDQKTTTVTTVTFKRIKEYVLKLKENTRRKKILVSPKELRKKLETSDKTWKFTDAEMMTAVGHLENHGYISILHSSSGEKFILLVPELLVSLASSIFLQADKHPRELGAINESELLQGKFPFSELEKLTKKEQLTLLDVAVVRFLEHSVCFRETLGNDTLLIFPSLIKQKRPLKDDSSSTDDISYVVRGRVENIYATLVVLLGYTSSFTRRNHWQNQAQYETDEEKICGFRLVEDREGEIELI